MSTNTIYQLVNARIVNEGKSFIGNVTIHDGRIHSIEKEPFPSNPCTGDDCQTLDLKEKYLMPGVIDDQVHFREPGLTQKADIYSESKAAIAGGITSYMEMPNTVPNTLTQELLEDKYQRAAQASLANYSFYMGASNENLEEILKTDPETVCGVKVFMGASTGNMLVDDINALNGIFSKSKLLVAVHCEDEPTIQKNLAVFKAKYGDDIPMEAHPLIRSHEACYKSSKLAVGLARLHNTRLHVLHISTARETELFNNGLPLNKKKITAEVCVHHLWFNNSAYEKLGTKVKWNPAIKTREDQDKLLQALLDDRLDVIATDHAPHKLDEKSNPYTKAPSGGPLVQHALPAMIDFVKKEKITIEKVVEKMCHAPAVCFQVKDRGFIRKDYFADLVVVDPEQITEVTKDSLLYKCGWSPFEGHQFSSCITHTFVNGHLVYNNGIFDESQKGKRLTFNR